MYSPIVASGAREHVSDLLARLLLSVALEIGRSEPHVRVGDVATDLLLKAVASGDFGNRVGYETHLPDGRRVKSSTTIIADPNGRPIAALCINTDVSAWETLRSLASSMLGDTGAIAGRAAESAETNLASSEVFLRNVVDLADYLLHQAIAKTGVPVDLMQKRHKIAIARELKEGGLFLLKDAMDRVATELGITRFTIYNDLNENSDGEGDDTA